MSGPIFSFPLLSSPRCAVPPVPPPQSPESKEAFAEVFLQLQEPSPSEQQSPATPTTERADEGGIFTAVGGGGGGAGGAGTTKDEDGADVDFLREM